MGAPSLARVTLPEIPPIAPTLKVLALLAAPLTVTTTGPVVAPDGTGTTIVLALQLLGAALTPLKVMVLVPCVLPKLEPLTVTLVPVVPADGEMLLIVGRIGKGTVTEES